MTHPTPATDKFDAAKPDIEKVAAFMEWAATARGLHLCQVRAGLAPVPCDKPVRALVAEYFGVDLEAVLAEKHPVLSSQIRPRRSK